MLNGRGQRVGLQVTHSLRDSRDIVQRTYTRTRTRVAAGGAIFIYTHARRRLLFVMSVCYI